MSTGLVDYGPGHEPPIREKLGTYHHFLIAARYIVLAHVVVGTFLVMAFASQATVFSAFVVALIELIIGLYVAKERKPGNWVSGAATLLMDTSADSGHVIEDRVAQENVARPMR
ncbi:MAG TPA: hypothetical protein VG407_08715 [Caulobacteraceae bacterium]|jgi:hypothetical protein|nr:hypothetical protein [Caulobacteraceae bacterium]